MTITTVALTAGKKFWIIGINNRTIEISRGIGNKVTMFDAIALATRIAIKRGWIS